MGPSQDGSWLVTVDLKHSSSRAAYLGYCEADTGCRQDRGAAPSPPKGAEKRGTTRRDLVVVKRKAQADWASKAIGHPAGEKLTCPFARPLLPSFSSLPNRHSSTAACPQGSDEITVATQSSASSPARQGLGNIEAAFRSSGQGFRAHQGQVVTEAAQELRSDSGRERRRAAHLTARCFCLARSGPGAININGIAIRP